MMRAGKLSKNDIWISFKNTMRPPNKCTDGCALSEYNKAKGVMRETDLLQNEYDYVIIGSGL